MINTSCVISKFDKNCKSNKFKFPYKFVDHAKHELLNYQTKYLYQCNKCFIIYTKDKRLKKELDKFYFGKKYRKVRKNIHVDSGTLGAQNRSNTCQKSINKRKQKNESGINFEVDVVFLWILEPSWDEILR